LKTIRPNTNNDRRRISPRQRVITSLSHQKPDRCPCNYLGTPEADEKLKRHFKTDDMDTVLDKLGVDLRIIDAPYVGPELRTWPDGRFENFWGHVRKYVKNQAGVYNEAVDFPYKDFKTIEDVKRFRWPRVDYFDYSTLPGRIERYRDYAIVFGATNYLDLINGTAFGRGVEQVMYDIAVEDPVGLACMEIRFQCCYERAERALQTAGKGNIDIFWIGEDLGTQNGLLISPKTFRKLIFDKLRQLCELGHRYGARVMMHSCGSTRALWPDLIEAGVDIYDTIQPEAADMDPASLKEEFGDRICFHGTISTQKTLPFGTPADVAAQVRQRIATVGRNGGFIVAPSHNIQPDTPVENILTLYDTVRSGS
jgi:uroporphyrinogen decarboxylase